ncbi:hypothetical protein [Candidatus Palauibacter sp.]|uniref:hypothetical protein n=1 Tax=Candidatus Palauibacter sp. TaxID=3101350 RepID=UPI003AF2B1C9
MIVTLRTERIRMLDEVRAFLEGSEPVAFTLNDRDSAHVFVRPSLERFRYHGLGKPDKGLVKVYLAKVTGLSRAQFTRLIAQHKRTRHIRDCRRKPPAKPFKRRYTSRDIALLAEIAAAYGQLSRPATKEVPRRQYELHGDERFKRLRDISNGHIYDLRKARAYRMGSLSLNKTRPVHIPIGVRRKPDPQGRPGFVRVDTVHQGRPRRREGPLRPWASSTMSPGSSTLAPSPASPRSSCSPSSTTSSPPSPSPSWASTPTVSIREPVSSPWSDSNTDRRLGGLVRGQPAEAPTSTDVVT